MSEQMKLPTLFGRYKDGDERGWDLEFMYLRRHHGARIRELTGAVLREGIREPILLGDDGRVWDGHHRLYVASALGFTHVPVKHARPEVSEPTT